MFRRGARPAPCRWQGRGLDRQMNSVSPARRDQKCGSACEVRFRRRCRSLPRAAAVGILSPDDDLPFTGGELHGIAQQVPENLAQARGIRLDPGILRLDLIDKSVPALSAVRKANGYCITQNFVRIDRFLAQRQLAAADTRQIEKSSINRASTSTLRRMVAAASRMCGGQSRSFSSSATA